MSLPQIPYRMAKNKSQMISMRSINYTDMLQDGDIVDSKNISARAYPYITTRKARERGDDYKNVEAITSFNGKIAHIAGGKFYYDGKEIGAVSNGAKKMEKINSKLVIFPDKIYFDAQDEMLHPMAASAGSNNVVFTKNSITVKSSKTLVAEVNGYHANGNVFSALNDSVVFQNTGTEIGGIGKKVIEFSTNRDEKYFTVCRWMPTQITFSEDYPNGVFYTSQRDSSIYANRLIGVYISGKGEYSTKITEYVEEAGKGWRAVLGSNKMELTDSWMAEISWSYNDDLNLGVGAVVNTEKYDPSEFSYIGDGEISDSLIESLVGGMPVDEFVITKANNNMYYYTASKVYKGTYIGKVTARGAENPKFTEKLSVGQRVLLEYGNKSEYAEVAALSDKSITTVEKIGYGYEYGAPCRVYSLASADEPYDFAADFKVGDAVFITGSSVEGNNLNFVISQIEQNTIFSEAEIFTEVEDSTFISIERRIPDLDFICESSNRIWGCSNSDNTVYASALGDPTNFYDYSGESTDSYASVVGSEGEFTACCRHGDTVLFWKEDKLHKMLGAYPAEYTIYSYDIEGVEAGSDGSIAVMNEVLYFKGREGIYMYTGGTPQIMSANFGDKKFHQAHAGVDGDSYYVSMIDDDGKSYLFVYESLSNLWVLEDDVRVRHFLRRVGDGLYMLTEGGEVYRCGAGDSEADMEWHLQFAPLYETIEGHKSYSRLVFRLELAHEGYVIVEVKTDGGVWREAGKVVGKREGLFPISLPINRCDKFEIRLRGKGKCKIHSIKREFYVGGDK